MPSPRCARRPSGQLGQRHFDVQLVGGVVLHRGMISEMKTGEGKDPGRHPAGLPERPRRRKGVHVVTVNDYLAKRDSEWMGAIYEFLGLSVGCIVHEPRRSSAERRMRPTPVMSPTAPTTNSASTICATT